MYYKDAYAVDGANTVMGWLLNFITHKVDM